MRMRCASKDLEVSQSGPSGDGKGGEDDRPNICLEWRAIVSQGDGLTSQIQGR